MLEARTEPHYPSFSMAMRTRPSQLQTRYTSPLLVDSRGYAPRTPSNFSSDWAMRTVDLRDSEDDGFEVKQRRRVPTFRPFDTIPEADEAEPPVAGLTPVRDDNESNISILYLDEEIPRQSPVPVRRRLLYAFLDALSFLNSRMSRELSAWNTRRAS